MLFHAPHSWNERSASRVCVCVFSTCPPLGLEIVRDSTGFSSKLEIWLSVVSPERWKGPASWRSLYHGLSDSSWFLIILKNVFFLFWHELQRVYICNQKNPILKTGVGKSLFKNRDFEGHFLHRYGTLRLYGAHRISIGVTWVSVEKPLGKPGGCRNRVIYGGWMVISVGKVHWIVVSIVVNDGFMGVLCHFVGRSWDALG